VLVVDSTAIVETLVATDPEPRLRARLAADGELHAPHNLTAYDAVYVALAAALDAPLITCDARLGAAASERARVEVFAPGPFPRDS
jgi:predicted nucleic acid-binding protein